LSPIKQRGGKTVHAWLVECDLDVSQIKSNTFSMEWPPRSGKFQDFAEIDRAEWFTLDVANERILEAQRALLAETQAKFW
jgi:predicted NUDIX family NTP pyrophosphohydrolase